MAHVDLPKFPTRPGYMTEMIQQDYISSAIAKELLPAEAHRVAEVLSLTAPSDLTMPIQFWQLYSVLGQNPIGQSDQRNLGMAAYQYWGRPLFRSVDHRHLVPGYGLLFP